MDKIKRILLKTVVICLNLVYGVFKLLPSPKKIVFLSRQFDNVSVDFDMISSALLKADSTWKVVFLTKRIKKAYRD